MIPVGSIIATDFGVAVVMASTLTDDGHDELIDARLVFDVSGYKMVSFMWHGCVGVLTRIH